MLTLAAVLLVLLGLAHSVLGERFILIPLFKRRDLPAILGSADFTNRTLRFAWHITTIAWIGFAAILYQLTCDAKNPISISNIIGITFLISGVIALIASRGNHLSWIVFLIIAALTLWPATFNAP